MSRGHLTIHPGRGRRPPRFILPPLLFALIAVLLAAPSLARAEPMVIDCHADTTFTPTLPKGFGDVQASVPVSSDPSIVVARLARKGGGTAGAIEITAQGHDGSVTITWAVKDTYTGQIQALRLNVEVYCGSPKKGTTGGGGVNDHGGGGKGGDPPVGKGDPGKNDGGKTITRAGIRYPRATHVVTSCESCQPKAALLNQQIDAYNARIDQGAPPADIEAARDAMNATVKALSECERRCSVVSTQPSTGSFAAPSPPKPKPLEIPPPAHPPLPPPPPARPLIANPGLVKPTPLTCPAGQVPVTIGGTTSCKPKGAIG